MRSQVSGDDASWLTVLRRYLLCVALGNLLWEFAHLPLYTIWTDAPAREIVFAAVHCTGGDILIATATLIFALVVAGDRRWPFDSRTYLRVALVAIGAGIAYTIFSEWLNVFVRRSWAYAPLMPIIPVFDIGLSPVVQWLAVPVTSFWFARRGISERSSAD